MMKENTITKGKEKEKSIGKKRCEGKMNRPMVFPTMCSPLHIEHV
jgi:hypothetical protein